MLHGVWRGNDEPRYSLTLDDANKLQRASETKRITLCDVCIVRTLALVHDTQFNADIARCTTHHTDILIGDAVVSTDWLVEGRTGRRADTDASVAHSAVSTDDTITQFCQHSQSVCIIETFTTNAAISHPIYHISLSRFMIQIQLRD